LTPGIGERIERMGRILRHGAEKEIGDYRRRFAAAAGLYEEGISQLMVKGFDSEMACRTAEDFFGARDVKWAAIDGTDYSRVLFDLVVFFGGSYAATGTLHFGPDSVGVEYDPETLDGSMGVCSCVPVYVNEVAELSSLGEEEIAVEGLLTDEEIVTNSEIASGIMTFAEFYLAYRLASDDRAGIRILLMDRSLSGEISSLMYDTAVKRRWVRSCSLLGYRVDGIPVDENELLYSRHHPSNPALGVLAPRGDYLIYAILHHLERGNKADLGEVCSALGLESAAQKKRASRSLARLKREGMVGDIIGNYRMASRYVGYWKRMRRLVIEIGERIFSQEGFGDAPMTIEVGGRTRHLTTTDLAFLTLFTINMLIEECWERRILLIGLTKDTAARDFKRHVLPLLSNIGALPGPIDGAAFQEIPNTDRMLLQATSMMNHEDLGVPWALAEYDCALRTIVHDPEAGPDRVRGAIRNRIVPERIMVKSYVQLAKAARDPRFRSNVLLVDRLVHPGYDAGSNQLMEFIHEYGGAIEPVSVILPRDASNTGPLQNLALAMLSAMTVPDIPELFGHNKPLFIADKVAKWNNECFRRMVETTAVWIRSNHDLRDFVFYMSSFRERRSTIEYARRQR
jgi:hypothetical protein